MEAYQQKRKKTQDNQLKDEFEESQPQYLAPSKAEPSQSLNMKVLSVKKISTGRNIDFDFLTEEGFSIGQKIKILGWDYFCSLDKPTYLDLVREFYMNLRLRKNRLYVIVKNTLIRVNPDILHK